MLQANTPHKPRLLILDEDRIILQSLSQFLRREGYEVKTSDNPEDAMNQLDGGQTELLLADINMPGVKPTEFLRDVRRRFPHVVTIVITGYGSIEGAVEATKMGAFDYLTKPIVDDEIRVVVERRSDSSRSSSKTKPSNSSSIYASAWRTSSGTTTRC
jgi:two-component system NtrC family response regulator